jgi:carbon-monoxide dehydrogenase medium subunit
MHRRQRWKRRVALLVSRSGNAKIMSGGQSLVPMLAFRLAAPELLVELKHD